MQSGSGMKARVGRIDQFFAGIATRRT